MSAAEIVKLVVEFGLEATEWILTLREEDREAGIEFLRQQRASRVTAFEDFSKSWRAAAAGVQAEIDDAKKRGLNDVVADAMKPVTE